MRDLVKERTENLQTIQNLQQHIQRIEQQVKFLSEEKGENVEISIQSLSNRVTQCERRLEKLENLDIQSVENNNKIDHVKEKQNIMKRFEEQSERMKLDNKTKQLEKENTNMRQKLSSQTKHVNQLEEKVKNEPLTEGIKIFLESNSKELEKLKIFAAHISKLHRILGSWQSDKYSTSWFTQDFYEDEYELNEWSDFIQEMRTQNIGEKYSNNLKIAIDCYEDNVYPSSWQQRLQQCERTLFTGIVNESMLNLYSPVRFERISFIQPFPREK